MTEQERITFDKKQLNITYGKLATYVVGIASVIFSMWRFSLQTQETLLKVKSDIEKSIEKETSRNDKQDEDITGLESWVRSKASKEVVEGIEKDVDNLRYRMNRYHN